ncbi:MAG: twin-arginine translocase subunit TatC [Anaerolineae bacterium]|nr:twin-arginine translocase subunit TatC [Anaerolineae bacterium]
MGIQIPRLNLSNLKKWLEESGIWEHLDELRKRVTAAFIGVVLCVVASFIFAQQILGVLADPAGGLDALQAIRVAETMQAFMRISLISGLIIAFPWVLFQVLAFLWPGLEKNERRWVVIGLPAATLLFLGGVTFTYFVMLPTAIPMLLTFLGVQTVPTVSDYINFVTAMMFYVGLSFLSPLIAFILAKLQILYWKDLAKHWRIAIVAIAVAAAVITPTGDPINMGLLMLPLTLLYGLSIFLARLARPHKDE